MDIETAGAIEAIRTDIAHLKTSASRVETSVVRLETSLVRVETSLRADMAAMRDELRRHTDIRFESLRDDIRILAEGVASLSARIDTLRPAS